MSLSALIRRLMTRSVRTRSAAPIRRSGRPLFRSLEALEDRAVPATFLEVGTQLQLVLDVPGTQVDITATGTEYTLTLTGDTWSGTDSGNVSGDTLATLTVSAGVFISGIELQDDAAGVAVNFLDSGANLYADSFQIALDDAAAGDITFAGASTFTGPASLAASTTQTLTVNAGAALTTEDGTIALAAAVLDHQGTIGTTTTPEVGLRADTFSAAAGATVVGTAVNIAPLTAGHDIDLGGADAAGTLGLDAADLDAFQTASLQIGDAGTGAIVVSAAINPTGVTTQLTIGASGGGGVALNNDVATAAGANLAIVPNVTLGNDVVLTAAGAAITLGGTVDGAFGLAFDQADVVAITGAVGSADPLTTLAVQGADTFTAASIAATTGITIEVVVGGTIAGNLTNTATLTKFAAGSLTLNGDNTHGDTIIDGGTLYMNGTNAGNVLVNEGGTLGGTGTIAGTVTVSVGGRVAPGTSPGVLATGSISWTAGSFFDVELGGTAVGEFDQLVVTGSVTLGGATLNLLQFGGFSVDPLVLQSFIIIDNDDSDSIDGTFNGLPEGSPISYAGGTVYISYFGGDGNDVVLYSQPVVNGTAGDDTLVLRRLSATQNEFSLNGAAFIAIDNTVPFTFDGGAGTDLMIVDTSNGDPIPTGNVTFLGEILRVERVTGAVVDSVTVTPAAVAGTGVVTITGFGNVNYIGTNAIDLVNLTAATILSGTLNDAITLGDGTTSSNGGTVPAGYSLVALDALSVAGVGSTVALHNIGSATVDTTTNDGDDTVTVNTATGAHGIGNLTIATGTGSDAITVAGPLTVSDAIDFSSQAIAVNALLTAGAAATVTLDAGTGAITTADTDLDISAAAVVATAATGIELDTAVAGITASTTGTGDIVIRESDGAAVVSVVAADGAATVSSVTGDLTVTEMSATTTATLTATAGAIVDGNAGAVNVTAAAVVATAATGIELDTAVAGITASTTGTGDIVIRESDGAAVVSVVAADGAATVSSVTGDLTVTEMSATTTATLTATAGTIVGVVGGTRDVTAATLIATAATGIDLETAVGAITATTTGIGLIRFNELDGVTLTSVIAHDGSITVNAGGTVNALNVVSTTDSDDNDIAIGTTSGDIVVAIITAGTGVSGDVTLAPTSGSILDDDDDSTFVTGDVLTLTAFHTIGAPLSGAAVEDLDTVARTINAATTAAIGDNGIWITNTGTVTFDVVSTVNGQIVLDATTGLTANTITSGGVGRDMRLRTTVSGDILLGTAAAADDAVLLAAIGAVLDNNGGAMNVTAAAMAATAGSGVGTSANPLDTNVTNLAASGSTGGVFVSDVSALTITDVTAFGSTVSGVSATGGGAVGLSAVGVMTADSAVSTEAGVIGLTTTGGPANGIALNAGVTSTSGAITADSAGTIVEAGAGRFATSNLLTTTSTGGQFLDGANAVGSFHATNSASGAVNLTNTAATLTIERIDQNGTTPDSTIRVDTTGNMVTTGLVDTTAAANGAITLTATSGAMTLGGAVSAGGSGAVDLTTTGAGNAIAVNAAVTTDSGAIAATAGGAITQTGGRFAGTSLTANSNGGQDLDGTNAVSSFTSTNAGGGAITLNNTAITLTIAGITQTTSGTIGVTNVGGVTVANPVNTPNGAVGLMANDGAMILNDQVRTNSGAVDLTTTGINQPLTVNAAVTATTTINASVSGNFATAMTNAILLDAGTGSILVVPAPNQDLNVTLQSEVRGSSVRFGRATTDGIFNTGANNFSIRPSKNVDVQVFGNEPTTVPGDVIFPDVNAIPGGATLQLVVEERNGNSIKGYYLVTFADNTQRLLRFQEIESLGQLGFQAIVVQTGAKSYDIRVQQNQAGTPISASVRGGAVPPNPFVVTPNYISPISQYSAPTVAFGDVNGDGTPDMIVANGANDVPLITVIDGRRLLDKTINLANLDFGNINNPLNRTGDVLAQFFAYEPEFRGGVSVAVADINMNGRAEIITGAGNGGGARVRIFELKDGFDQLPMPERMTDAPNKLPTVVADGRVMSMFNFFAFEPSFRGGVNVAAGDIDGDGTPDLVLGAGVGGAPRVMVFSGADGKMLMNFYAYNPSMRGGVLVAAGDFKYEETDGKRRDEILTGPGFGGTPHLQVFNFLRPTTEPLASFFALDYSPTVRRTNGLQVVNPIEVTGVGGVAFGGYDATGKQQDILVTSARGPRLVTQRYTGGPALTLAGTSLYNQLTSGVNSFAILDPFTGQPLAESMLSDGATVGGGVSSQPAP